jgi:hypothetical protein
VFVTLPSQRRRAAAKVQFTLMPASLMTRV